MPDRSSPGDRRTIRIVDTHYGGDVSRIVLGGIPRVPGRSVRDKRSWLAAEGDDLRRMLLGPPYGDPSMCANVIVDPSLPGAQAGYVIMEAMGYPHFSGSNSICVTAALLESGEIAFGPPGDQTVASDHGFALTAPERPAVADFANELCLVATADLDLVHPSLGDTGDLSFVCLAGDLPPGPVPSGTVTRSATYVHPGVVCRCPTGTSTAARMALLADDGRLGVGDELVTESPTGSQMTGRLLGDRGSEPPTAWSVSITGRPFTLGVTQLVVNRDDALTDCEGIWDLLGGADFERSAPG